MTDIVAELSARARQLEPEDRVRLAQEILQSLESEVDPEIDAAWDAEIRKRVAEIEAGTTKLVPADEVFAKARRSLR